MLGLEDLFLALFTPIKRLWLLADEGNMRVGVTFHVSRLTLSTSFTFSFHSCQACFQQNFFAAFLITERCCSFQVMVQERLIKSQQKNTNSPNFSNCLQKTPNEPTTNYSSTGGRTSHISSIHPQSARGIYEEKKEEEAS